MIAHLNTTPRVIFTALEIQCFYCTEKSKVFRLITRLFREHLATYGPNEEKPFDESKIERLKKHCIKNPSAL